MSSSPAYDIFFIDCTIWYDMSPLLNVLFKYGYTMKSPLLRFIDKFFNGCTFDITTVVVSGKAGPFYLSLTTAVR